MNKEQIIRAWKDEDYRASLSSEETSLLPEHPAGMVALTSAELDGAAGGGAEEAALTQSWEFFSMACCKTGIPSWFFTCYSAACCDQTPTFDFACK